jgi:mRNA interferase MazF
LNRGEIYEVDLPIGRRPAVIITRQTGIPLLANVTVVAITSMIRDLPTEVPVDTRHGLEGDSVINCDNVFTVPKRQVLDFRGSLGITEIRQLDDALRIALQLD